MSDCQCPDPSLCQRLRRHIAGRDWEWWTGDCPPEQPCDPETRQRIITAWEANAATLPSLEAQRRRAERDARLRRWALRLRWLGRYRRFARALWRHVRHGLPTASPADQAGRWAQCEGCEFRDRQENLCTKCLCKLSGRVASKITWARESCPLDPPRWGPVRGETLRQRVWRWLTRR